MKKPAAFVLFAAVLLQSCVHYYYVPNVQNVPLFTERGEFQLSGHLGGGTRSNSFDAQMALALTDNIGFAANYMFSTDGNLHKDDYSKGNYIEGAIGYFQPVNKNGVFEIYGGFGGGGQHHQYEQTRLDYSGFQTYHNSADLSYLKFYLQPAYGFKFNICDLAFSTRFSRLSYTEITTNLDRESEFYFDLNSLSNQGHFFIEPAITFRIGWESVKAQMQYIYSGYVNNTHLYQFEEQHFSVGLVFSINNKEQQ